MTDTDLFLEVLNEAIDNYNLQKPTVRRHVLITLHREKHRQTGSIWYFVRLLPTRLPRLCQAEQIKRELLLVRQLQTQRRCNYQQSAQTLQFEG